MDIPCARKYNLEKNSRNYNFGCFALGAYELRVPPIGVRGSRPGDEALLQRLRACDQRYERLQDCFGLELKCAWQLAENETAWRFVDVPRQEPEPNLKRFLLRPASEPILLSWWDRLKTLSFNLDDVVSFASALHGAKLAVSQNRMRSRGDSEGNYTLYATPQEAAQFLEEIRSTEPLLESVLERALYRFVKTLYCHPLVDANGRLARAFLIGALADSDTISSPILPLGPVYYRNSDIIIGQIRDLSDTGDWDTYFSDASKLIETALSAAEAFMPA